MSTTSLALAGARRMLKLRKATLVATAGKDSGPLGPETAAASAMLGAALGRVPDLIDHLLDGRPVVVVLEVADDAWADVVTKAARACFRSSAYKPSSDDDRDPGSVETTAASRRPAALRPVRVFVPTSSKAVKDVEAATVAIAEMDPVLAVATNPKLDLPEVILRTADHRLVAERFDSGLLALVVAASAGARPRKTLSADVLGKLDLVDLRLALHRERGPDGCIERLDRIIRPRLTARSSSPRLSELAGYGAAQYIGMGIAADLKNFASGRLGWSQCERGLLVSGPPGCGKTLMAGAIAAEAQVPLVVGSLAVWQGTGEAHLGTTLKAMRATFDAARMTAPAILFIDELDSFGDRQALADHHRSYGVQIINGLLEQLDGARGREGIYVVGATNAPHLIDPAITRSGRFDRRIELGLPTFADIQRIFRHHLESDLAEDDLAPLARRAIGCTGADLANLVRRARGIARREDRPLALADLDEAVGGETRPANDESIRRTAVHESGHAVVAHALGMNVGDIIVHGPFGATRGSASIEPPEIATPETCKAILAVAMAGRAAEIEIFGEPSAGASADLAFATKFASDIHAAWGLGHWLSTRDPGRPDGRLRSLVESEIRHAFERASNIIAERRGQLDLLATVLLECRALTRAEVVPILDGRPSTAPDEGPSPASGAAP